MDTWSIATFNVNSVRTRLPVITRWLSAHPMDILCLQETKVDDTHFPSDPFSSLGYHAYFRGEKSYNGAAILSREKLIDVRFGFEDGEKPAAATRLVLARYKKIHILNTYVPQGKSIDHPDYSMKLRFLERIRQLLEERFRPSDLLLWVGDMNVAPTDKDVTRPATKKKHVCFHSAVRETFAHVVSWGFIDVFRKHRPGEGEFTFWDYRVKNSLERNIGWRVDHILATPPLADVSLDCLADREVRAWDRPPDHTVVKAVFQE